MFRDLFNPDASTPRGQRLDLNRSATRIFKTLSAGGYGYANRPMNNNDEYINNTLVEKFSKLTVNDPSLASYVRPRVDPSALSIPMLTSSQGNTPILIMPTFANPEQQPSANIAYPLNDTEGRHDNSQAIGQVGITDTPSRSSQMTLPRQKTKGPIRTKIGRKERRRRRGSLFPMSIKRDLTPVQIRRVASSLIRDNAISYVLENHQFIFEAWTSSSPIIASTSVDESVVAAFDIVHSLAKSKERKRLDLRFAYIHLNCAINALDAAGEAGYADIYFNAKGNSSDISSSQLSDYVRRGKRWAILAGPLPFQLSIFSRLAETIMYVLPAPSANPFYAEYL
jgi:hypothetical protein